MDALITGATGFIGSHLAERLDKMGYKVSCLVRSLSDLKWLSNLNVRLIKGNCTDKDSLKGVTEGFDYVFHLAGLTKATYGSDFDSVNFHGTENVISAVAESNTDLKRFVYLSSLSAYGPGLGGKMPEEDIEAHPVSNYGKSKLKGEEAVLRYHDRVPVTILRPSAVYGPRDREFFIIIRFINKGLLPYWGDGRISLVYVDDLIDAIMASAKMDEALGKTFFISDGEVYTNETIISEIASALSTGVIKLKLPKVLLPAIGFFAEKISKIVGDMSMVNRDKMKELKYADWSCDISRARRELGFEPDIGFKEGIKWTIDWYRIQKWL